MSFDVETQGANSKESTLIRRLILATHIVLGLILLAGPWVFLGVVWAHHEEGGIQAPTYAASLVQNHPHIVDFVVTTLTVIVAVVVVYIFKAAVTFTHSHAPTADHADVFKHMKAPTLTALWSIIYDRKQPKKSLPLLLLASRAVTSTLIGPGLNALVIPHSFIRIAPLRGTELDFSTTDPSCLEWISANTIPSNCNWRAYKDFKFTDCLGENQLTDVLESSRNNMRSLLSNNTETLTFTQLGGMHFYGPIHGVFPVGPNGIPSFDTLDSFPTDTFKNALSYNYSLDLQGISSAVRCQYDTSTPIVPVSFPRINQTGYGATCPTGETVAPYTAEGYPIPRTINPLGAWPCKTSPVGGAYTIFFRGRGNYEDVIGNMSCEISPIQYSVFPVRYSSKGDQFVVSNETLSSSNTTSQIIDRAVFAVVNTVAEAQGFAANLAAESVITYGVRTFGLPLNGTYVRNDVYLRLVEAMIQGIVQYELTYIRLIYSSYSAPPGSPGSCMRAIAGQLSSEVIGWSADLKTPAYLIPLTLIIVTALMLLVVALFKADGAHRAVQIKSNAEEALGPEKETLTEKTKETLMQCIRDLCSQE